MVWITWILKLKRGADKALEEINRHKLEVKVGWITKGSDHQ